MKLPCQLYEDLMTLYIDQALTPESTAILEEHLKECPHCRSYLDTINETLPPVLDEHTHQPHEVALIKRLKRKLLWLQGGVLFVTLLISSLFTLSDNMFQNILLLPIIGFLAYLFTKKTLLPPTLISIVLVLIGFIKEGVLLSNLSILPFWFAIYFVVTLLGSGIGLALNAASTNFKTQKPMRKAGSIGIYIVSCVLMIGILLAYDSANGNPITALYAKSQMEKYVEETYPGYEYAVHNPSYSFKVGGYNAEAYLFTPNGSNAFTIGYSHGSIWDDYFEQYLYDAANSHRLAKEARTQLKELLISAGIPFDTLDVSISVAKDRYNQVSYHPEKVTEPLSITLTKYTDTKDDYETFATWCETIRQLLVTSGYPIEDVTLDSDPHFMIDRLSYRLTASHLMNPIDLTKSKDAFQDYGAINSLNNLSKEDYEASKDWDKDTFIYDEAFSIALENFLSSKGFQMDDVRAETLNSEVTLSLTQYGKRISMDRFAETLLSIRSLLAENQEILNGFTLSDVNFTYCWGTDYDAYHYTLSKDTPATLSPETLVENLLNDEKFGLGSK